MPKTGKFMGKKQKLPGCRVEDGEKWRIIVSVWDDGKVLERDSGDGCTKRVCT